MEEQLNNVKNLLSRPDFEDLKKRDPWEREIRNLRSNISKNFGGQNVTRAWLKMYEILTQTEVGPHLLKLGNRINCFFNAELPGGFIYAVNHFLRTNNKSFDWLISSYLSATDQGSFLKDEFHLLTKYPGNSLAGKITTNQGVFWSNGDLTNPKVPAILATLAQSVLHPVHLYTADGGFDVGGREEQQEVLSAPLIKGEIECGLRCLGIGGVMVIKIFTFFSQQMVSILTLLIRVFNKYDIYKPQTSGQLNSESYFIGIGYRGITQDELNNILNIIPNDIEYKYLSDKITSLVTTQINNINGFLSGKGPVLQTNMYNFIQNLNSDQKL
jgi:hypothetical protein